ncbi:MAG: glycosyltransferase family 4 protein [Candidatus Bipolaricaulia bacterium]
MTKPSVWILNHYANLPGYPGPTRHYDLAKRLVQRGFDVTVIASSFRRTAGILPVTGREPFLTGMIEGIRFVWLRADVTYSANDAARVRNMVEFAWRAWRYGRSRFGGAIPSPDVVVGSSPHLLTPVAAWLLARKFRARFVFEVRDLWPETFVAFGFLSRWNPLVVGLRVLERFLYRRSAKVISLLPEGWRYITRCGVPKERIVWVPNGVNPSKEVVPRADEQRPFTVMYLGSQGRSNVLEDLILASSLLQESGANIRVVLVGGGKSKHELVSMAEERLLTNVEFRGEIPKNCVFEVMEEADAFVALLEDTPLYRYGVSLNKLFDYMNAGRPVILAGDPAHNYVELAECGITIPPRSASELSAAVMRLAEMSPEARRAMGERGRAYVRAHHDWDLLGERLANALDSAVGVPRSIRGN